MEPLACSGTCAIAGHPIQLAFQDAIHSVTPSSQPADLYLAPGFIDLQVNGFAGVDYNAPRTPHAEIARSLRAQFATGVTRLYATVITGAPEAMQACLRNLAAARESVPEGYAIDGFHVEGPHISPEDGPRGAHPRQWVRPPDLDEFYRWQDAARGRVRIVTLSPEWPQAPRYIERITAEGVVASIGHTQAGAAQIADAVHLGAAFLKSAIRAKTVGRSVLVTDAATPAGAAPGRYLLADQPVDLTADGRVVLAGTDRLAGSALHMHRGIENLMRLAGLPLADAVRMATVNPARAGKVPGRGQGLVPGERADIVQLRVTPSGQIEIAAVWLAGVLVFSRGGSPIANPSEPPSGRRFVG